MCKITMESGAPTAAENAPQNAPDGSPSAGQRELTVPTSLRHTVKNDKFWREMFENIGLRRRREPPKKKTWKEWLAMVAVVALGIGVLCQVVYRVYIDFTYAFDPIDIDDGEALREVMFGGRPYLVLCRWPELRRWKIPEPVDKYRLDLLKHVKLARIDCSGVLPSGLTFAERFKIPTSSEGFLVANGKAPRLLNPWALQNRKNLMSYVDRHTKLEFRTIDDNPSLARRCLSSQGTRCLLFISKNGLPAQEKNTRLQKLLGSRPKTRKLRFGIIDNQKTEIKLHSDVERPNRRFYETDVLCIANVRSPSKDKPRGSVASQDTFLVKYYRGQYKDNTSLLDFAESCFHSDEGSTGFVQLPRTPSIARK